MGARSIDGKLTHEINSQLGIAAGLSYAAIRLGNSDPEEVGIRGDKLLAINAIIRKAIREKAFPGCQLLVARQGRIILNKSFGTHQYATQKAVENGDLYDLASITKIAATTIGIMKAYELGMIDLQDQVGQHLPKLKGGDVGGVTIAQLLAHQSGIQPNIPLRYSILHRDSTDDTCDDYLCFEQSDLFPERAAEHIYVKNGFIDSVLARIHTIKIESGRRYRYSDVNFLLLQKILEGRSGMTLEKWLGKHFYEPLDLPTMAFRPLSKVNPERIVPTERDLRWRHQLLRGYVHDEAAALLGGVAGHAGLFSNAEDLATLMQMLLNGGRYGGITFLQPTTIKLFTAAQNGSHRGLGFDKPKRGYGRNHAKYMSSMSFGHLGFTGTCVWVDPQEELIYIFLSNRIHPSIANKKLMRKGIRGKIHQVVYDALDTYSDQWPDLPDPLLPYDGRIISQVVMD
ncbi:MAG: serine hydrolase [Saprospiraceae bacterium]|nr:serine hydrolase [Saprospiraceae bacterium]